MRRKNIVIFVKDINFYRNQFCLKAKKNVFLISKKIPHKLIDYKISIKW